MTRMKSFVRVLMQQFSPKQERKTDIDPEDGVCGSLEEIAKHYCDLLRDGPLSTIQLAELSGVTSRKKVVRQLHVLARKGHVKPAGKDRTVRGNPPTIWEAVK